MTQHSHFQTLSALLLARADSDQRITFIDAQANRQSVSFGEMLQRALQRLAHLQSKGAVAGSVLIIQSSNNALFIEAFWACLLGGIVAVPVVTGNNREQRNLLFLIAQKLDSPFLFSSEGDFQQLEQLSEEFGLHDDFNKLASRLCLSDAESPPGVEPKLATPTADDVAFIQFSSGSTRVPKGVVLSHQNILLNAGSIIEGCKMSNEDHLLSWMPLTHDMGLIGFHLTPLLCNTSHSLIPTDVFVRRPVLWLSEAQQMRASILCSPNFGYEHVLKSFKPEKQPRLDLSSVRLLFNGAEPISVSLCQQFMQTMSSFGLDANAMIPVYGLAEASLAVTFPSLHQRFTTLTLDRSSLALGQTVKLLNHDSDGVQIVSVGKPVAHVQLLIKDEQGAQCNENVTGRICIRGNNVTRGYYNEPALNEKLIDSEGWLDTGDLGFVNEKQLYITGRVKDIIFVNGLNVYPQDLEELLIQERLVERGKVVVASQAAIDQVTTGRGIADKPATDQISERLLVFILHRAELAMLAPLARDITRTLAKEAGVNVYAVVAAPRIPKTSSGKVRRFYLVTEFAQGSYPSIVQTQKTSELAPQVQSEPHKLGSNSDNTDVNIVKTVGLEANSTSSRLQLLAICNAQIEGMHVEIDDNLFDLGISSMTLAQIHASIEDVWPGQVDITDLFDYPTVAELSVYINKKVGTSP